MNGAVSCMSTVGECDVCHAGLGDGRLAGVAGPAPAVEHSRARAEALQLRAVGAHRARRRHGGVLSEAFACKPVQVWIERRRVDRHEFVHVEPADAGELPAVPVEVRRAVEPDLVPEAHVGVQHAAPRRCDGDERRDQVPICRDSGRSELLAELARCGDCRVLIRLDVPTRWKPQPGETMVDEEHPAAAAVDRDDVGHQVLGRYIRLGAAEQLGAGEDPVEDVTFVSSLEVVVGATRSTIAAISVRVVRTKATLHHAARAGRKADATGPRHALGAKVRRSGGASSGVCRGSAAFVLAALQVRLDAFQHLLKACQPVAHLVLRGVLAGLADVAQEVGGDRGGEDPERLTPMTIRAAAGNRPPVVTG